MNSNFYLIKVNILLRSGFFDAGFLCKWFLNNCIDCNNFDIKRSPNSLKIIYAQGNSHCSIIYCLYTVTTFNASLLKSQNNRSMGKALLSQSWAEAWWQPRWGTLPCSPRFWQSRGRPYAVWRPKPCRVAGFRYCRPGRSCSLGFASDTSASHELCVPPWWRTRQWCRRSPRIRTI